MIDTKHTSALPSHYDADAEHYDAFNEKRSETMNQVIEDLLKEHKIKSVLDLTCGTGSQVFWLKKRGYQIVGSDINAKMLDVARNRARQEALDSTFVDGDMRSSVLGTFDAVLTIFNAVGHLTREDFEKAMKNVHKNLKVGGIYIFDIFNLEYFLEGDNITKLTIDWMEVKDNKKLREIQYSTVNDEGVLASYTTSFECEFSGKTTKTHEGSQTLQIYSADQLKDMLERNGFDLVLQRGLESQHLSKTQTERILTVARKI